MLRSTTGSVVLRNLPDPMEIKTVVNNLVPPLEKLACVTDSLLLIQPMGGWRGGLTLVGEL